MEIVVNNFDLYSTLMSGECFRVRKINDNEFINILEDRVIHIKQDSNRLIVTSNNNDNLKEVIINYFDLKRNYEEINNNIIESSPSLRNMINKCNGYRILNQGHFETCISYIISQNNNVRRISASVEELSKKYGKKVLFEGIIYYLFPTYENIKDISLEELRSFKVGFRDKYIKDFLNNYDSIKDLDKFDTETASKTLMNIKGIGLKVSSCILLFSYERLDTFPIDTWVKKYISENSNIKNDEKSIKEYAKLNYKEYSGLIIQYMFHSQRNIKKQ